MAWTESRVATLTKLWAEGLSGTEIALRMGTTRCAVLGKVWTLGLPKRITKGRAAYGSGALVRSTPKHTPPPRKAVLPVSLSVPMRATGRKSEQPSTFDASPASQLAAALLASATAAQARRDGYRATAWSVR